MLTEQLITNEAMEGLPVSAEHFGSRLRELRMAAGLSRDDLAARVNLRPSAVRDFEQGRKGPSWKTAVAIAAALGVALDEFIKSPEGSAPMRRGRPRKPKPADENPAGEAE